MLYESVAHTEQLFKPFSEDVSLKQPFSYHHLGEGLRLYF